MQFNTKRFFKNYVEKNYQVSPNSFVLALEDHREEKNLNTLKNKKKNAGFSYNFTKYYKTGSSGYGLNADVGLRALTEEERKDAEKLIVDKIIKHQHDRIDIEKRTRAQSDCQEWHEIRKTSVTASNYGKIYNCRGVASYKGHLKSFLTGSFYSPACLHGKEFEKEAIKAFSLKHRKKVDPCGVLIDEHIFYLAATPDGIISAENCLVEVKCPYFTKKNKKELPSSIVDAVERKLGTIYQYLKADEDGELHLNMKHAYYAQVQGQLNVWKKDFCYFIVYLHIDDMFVDMFVEKIAIDTEYWNRMIPKLTDFFHGSMLPNLVEARNHENLLEYEKWKYNENTVKLYSDDHLKNNKIKI